MQLAELDIRQHSSVHERVISELVPSYGGQDEPTKIKILTSYLLQEETLKIEVSSLNDESRELLNVFKAIKDSHDNVSKKSIRCYITSFTHEVSDLLEVLLLAKQVGIVRVNHKNNEVNIEGDLDIVPLFETGEDLKNAGNILNELFKNPFYKKYLESRNSFQEIMLGYSDSNKDVGYLAANIDLFYAQRDMKKACIENGIDFRFFHGRGGSISRGGGHTGRAIQRLPEGTVNGHMRFTEQGWVLFNRYSPGALAHRHLEAIIHSVILKDSNVDDTNDDLNKWNEISERLTVNSSEKYRDFVYRDQKEFLNYFKQATPIEYLGKLNNASRPDKRTGLDTVEDLRAIPWVFSWTQTRTLLTAWYGVGTALKKEEHRLNDLQRMYKECPFFKPVIDNCELSLAKADMDIAIQYASLVEPLELGAKKFKEILDEYELTREMILKVKEEKELLDSAPVLQKSIRLRNPYTDPLNFLQVEMLRRAKKEIKEQGQVSEKTLHAILLTIDGISSGLQDTG